MRIFLLAPVLLGLSTIAGAAERGYSVTDFDRIRVDGPYRVTLATGRSPGARAFGSQGAIDAVAVELQGRLLIVRRSSQSWGGYPGQPAGPVEVRLTTHGLRGAAVSGAGSLTIDRLKGQSLDLAVAGSGRLEVGAIETDRLSVAVVGSGVVTVSGTAATAQIGVRGTGAVEGERLTVKSIKVAAEGAGDLRITATQTASVLANGTGNIVVLGNPACTIKAPGSGTVACGD